jgi:hypothetical protein
MLKVLTSFHNLLLLATHFQHLRITIYCTEASLPRIPSSPPPPQKKQKLKTEDP